MWHGLLLIGAALLAPGSEIATAAGDCGESPGFSNVEIEGEVCAGETFRQPFGSGLVFLLKPTSHGFQIAVHDEMGEDLSRLTPPLRGVNARFIDGWHFRNRGNTGANEGSVNAPQRFRDFTFSPEVGRTLGVAPSGPTAAEVERVAATGRGELEILDYGLAGLEPGERARMVWASFRVCLEWDAALGVDP